MPTATVASWIGVGIDITESKQIEQELRDYEYETRLAFGAGHMGSWRWDANSGRGTWSPELEDLVGVERGSYDGTWESFVAPILVEDGPRLREAIVDAAERGVEFAVGYRIRRPDGVIRWIETRGRELTRRRLDRHQHRCHRESRRPRRRCGTRTIGSRRPSGGSTRCSPTRRSASRSTTGTFGTSA